VNVQTGEQVAQSAAATTAQQGGLPDMAIPVTSDAVATTPPPETKKEKFIIGSREFASADEAMAYANGLAEIQSRVTGEQSQPPQPAAAPQKKLGQVLFEDPDAALDALEARILEKADQKQRAIDQTKKIWDDFYLKHPDLRGNEDIVDMILNREQVSGNFKAFTIEQALPVLAQKARDRLHRASNAPQGGTALPPGQATVAGASGQPAPRTLATPEPMTNFVSELRSLRKKG
jgi:hypothetical protein